jgi:hypothetical protein
MILVRLNTFLGLILRQEGKIQESLEQFQVQTLLLVQGFLTARFETPTMRTQQLFRPLGVVTS